MKFIQKIFGSRLKSMPYWWTYSFFDHYTLQKLAYYSALYKGYDIDKPRNLAKSVTVE